MHFSYVHFVLCQIFGLNYLMPPFHAFFSPPPLYCFLLGELKCAITSPKKGQAKQRCHEEQTARSKGAHLSPLDLSVMPLGRTVLNLAAQNREAHDSQNRGPGIVRNSAARSKPKKRLESQSSRIAEKSIQSMLKVTLESHDANRTIQNRPILDSESPIECH